MLFALVLRNTYISSYEILVENFPFPSLLLEEISSGATNAVKGVQNAGKISENACLQKYFAGDPKFQICQFSKKYFSIASLSEENRELGFHIARYVAKKIKKHLSGCCHGLSVADSITRWSPDFWYMKISRRRGLTAPFLDLNYSCTNFAN